MKRANSAKSPRGPRRESEKSERRSSKAKTKAAAPAESRPESRKSASAERVDPAPDPASCYNCSKVLAESQRALFVEEEIGRIFCSEACIAGYFTPEIERLEKEYFKRLVNGDLSGEERENLEHLRWITLQEPDEVWMEKTLSGDNRFTLISEFQPGSQKVWCICICLFLRGEPSFLYLAFPTKNAAMVAYYRKGERVEWVKPPSQETDDDPANRPLDIQDPGVQMIDRLAEDWTEEETLRAQLVQERSSDDIPAEEFGLYQSCLDETLETPDEVWSYENGAPPPDEHSIRFYHFIRFYEEHEHSKNSGLWYVIIARETDDEEQIEILDAFPTRDTKLVDRYRRGDQEVGHTDRAKPTARVIH